LEKRIVEAKKSGRKVDYEDYGREEWAKRLQKADVDFMKDTEEKERRKNVEKTRGDTSPINAERLEKWKRHFEGHRDQNAFSVSQEKKERMKKLMSSSVYERNITISSSPSVVSADSSEDYATKPERRAPAVAKVGEVEFFGTKKPSRL